MLFTVVLLIGVAVAFAISIGAHYTGACMGMPRAAGAIDARRALLLMAPLSFLGAALASERVETTVGHGILASPHVGLGLAIAIVAAALALTSAYNFLTLPTSTIQILVFATVGGGIAAGVAVNWATIESLVVLWAVAPFAAFGLAALIVRAGDRWRSQVAPTGRLTSAAVIGLVAVGSAASFAMGANDVSNASGALVMTGQFDLELAAVVGGIGLAVGVVTWGRPLLERVAFRVVRLDARMSIASQLAQSVVVLASVAFGLFTSLNQALVGAMIGTGVARGQSTVLWKPVRDILVGWALGPTSGALLGFAFAWAALRIGGA